MCYVGCPHRQALFLAAHAGFFKKTAVSKATVKSLKNKDCVYVNADKGNKVVIVLGKIPVTPCSTSPE